MEDILLLRYLDDNPTIISKIKQMLEDEYKMSKHTDSEEEHIQHLVSKLYHIEDGEKIYGEKFTLHKAKEIKERYTGIIDGNISCYDIYLAINAHYHDYYKLFKMWFPNCENKIIEAAIVYWFKDDDYNYKSKIKDYIKVLEEL